MHIIVDFDYTLFDTHALRQALISVWKPFGVTAELFAAEEEKMKEVGSYELEQHIAALIPEEHSEAAIAVAVELVAQGSQFVYSDAVDFLQRYSDQILVLLSYGDPMWQKRKIDGSGLTDYVETVILTQRDKSEEIEAFPSTEKICIITDRGSEIDAMYTVRPDAYYVHVQRPGTPYVTEVSEHTSFTATDLSFNLPL